MSIETDRLRAEANASGYRKGRLRGMQVGERKGYKQGHHVGYNQGFDDGFDKGYAEHRADEHRADELRKREKGSRHEAVRPRDFYGNPKPDTDPDSDPGDPMVTTSKWWSSDDETTMPLSQISMCPQPDGPGSLHWWWPEPRPGGRRRRSIEAQNIDETNVAGSSTSSGQKRVRFDDPGDAKRARSET